MRCYQFIAMHADGDGADGRLGDEFPEHCSKVAECKLANDRHREPCFGI